MDTTPPTYDQGGAYTLQAQGSTSLAFATSNLVTSAITQATIMATAPVAPAATFSTALAVSVPNTPVSVGGTGTPSVTAAPVAPGSGNGAAANATIYHQIGQPHLTGPNPIPNPGVTVAPPLQPVNPLNANPLNANPLDAFYPPTKYELVPRPEAGFPVIKGHMYKTIWAHLDPATLRFWEKQTGPGIIAFSLSNNGAVNTAKVTLFHEMLRDSLLAPNLFVIAPNLMCTHYTEHKPITPYYIGGITNFQCTLLLHWNVWVTPKAAFFIIHEDNFISDYIMTLENTFLDNDDASIAKVMTAMIMTIMNDDRHVFKDFIDEHHDAYHPHLTTNNILDTIVGDLQVIPLQITERGASITLFNVYAPLPTRDGDAYDQWVLLFHNHTYEFYSTMNTRYLYNCGTCAGQDHLSGKCPFHNLAGWHKPAANKSKYDRPINMNGKGPYDNRNGSAARGWEIMAMEVMIEVEAPRTGAEPGAETTEVITRYSMPPYAPLHTPLFPHVHHESSLSHMHIMYYFSSICPPRITPICPL